MHFQKEDETVTFYKGPTGATLGTAMNNFCSSSNKVSTHYITWLFSFWIWRRRCLKFAWFWPFGALPMGPHGGHTYYLNNFESPTPKDDSCQVWLKSNHAFSRRRWKCKKFTDDGRRTTDENGRQKLTRAFGSGELKIYGTYLHVSGTLKSKLQSKVLVTSEEEKISLIGFELYSFIIFYEFSKQCKLYCLKPWTFWGICTQKIPSPRIVHYVNVHSSH